MRVLTLGGSWVKGYGASSPEHTWPGQLQSRYQIDVVNLGQFGSGNSRNMRIALEELARDSSYDYVILGITAPSRQEILINGKYQQIWPNRNGSELDQMFVEFWHPWNDIQNLILQSFTFINVLKGLSIPLFLQGIPLDTLALQQELSWIENYQDDYDFEKLGMPLEELNIGIKDLDRKLKALRAMHLQNLDNQPKYLHDIDREYLLLPETQTKHQITQSDVYDKKTGHPNDQVYAIIADYFAQHIGL